MDKYALKLARYAVADSIVIPSLLYTDFYKFSMGAWYFENHSNGTGSLLFTDRLDQLNDQYKELMVDAINTALTEVSKMSFTKWELDYLFKHPMLSGRVGYREYLRNFKLDRSIVHCDIVGGRIKIWTDEASVLSVSMWEIYVLQIVNYLYNMRYDFMESDYYEISTNVVSNYYDNMKMPFIEFGTRRSHSIEFHMDYMNNALMRHYSNYDWYKYIGTSNPNIALQYKQLPYGTMAHEVFMYAQSVVPVEDSQKYVYESWLDTFGDGGYALHDTFGEAKFLIDFSKDLAQRYAGIRLDSGDPFKITEELVKMYKGYGIDPTTKTVMYSDSMNVDVCNELYDRFNGKIIMVAGIGSDLTSINKTNFVCKLVTANGKPTVKLSCDVGKAQCIDDNVLKDVREVIL